MTESRDLTISVYLNMADHEFKQTFNPKERHTPINALKLDIESLSDKLEEEIEEATKKENYEAAKELSGLKKDMENISENAEALTDDDVTDKRYQLEDRKRKLAQAIDNATKDKRTAAARADYINIKERCQKLLNENGNDYEHKHFNDIVVQEPAFLISTNPIKIQEKTEELHAIVVTILWGTPEFLIAIFKDLSQKATKMNDQTQAKSLLDAGKFAIESQNWDRLGEIDSALINLLPKSVQKEINTKIGF